MEYYMSKNQNNSQQLKKPDSNNLIRELLQPKCVGNKFTKHGQMGEVDAKVYLNTNGHQV